MNFAAYQQFRTQWLAANPTAIDAGETNLYRTFAQWQPVAVVPGAKIHRCHLAEAWVDYFGLPRAISKCALCTHGVRHSLAVLFRHFKTKGETIWLPSDVYPVYLELAQQEQLEYRQLPTLPALELSAIDIAGGPSRLLIANPLKPLGRFLNEVEVKAIETWLRGDQHRRVLIDIVYTYDNQLPSTTRRLWETGQAILLHSITKGWLSPKVFGITMVPEADFAQFASDFRALELNQSALTQAHQALGEQANIPGRVAAGLRHAQRRAQAALPDVAFDAASASYFAVVPGPWESWLQRGVLGIPGSVFGSDLRELTVMSSLAFANRD